MNQSIAHPPVGARSLDVPGWKTILSVSAAVMLGLLFIVAGVWKITDPYGTATRMIQAKVSPDLALFAALLLGIAETFAGILLFVARYRRWGAWLTAALLIVFMIYIGVNYHALRGEECSCFPLIKRAVGPGFFVGDALMLLFAAVAAAWSRPSNGMRTAAIILGAVCVFSLASFGVTYARQTGTKAPDTITVNANAYSLQHGKKFLYFFDPECSHCYQAAKQMASFKWKDVEVIGIPTAQPRFAASFMQETGLNAKISNDLELLKKVFPFVAGPFGVALENGRQTAQFIHFEGDQPEAGLKKLGFID